MSYKFQFQMNSQEKQSLLDKRYLRMARIWSENSYCQRRKVGALLVKDQIKRVVYNDLYRIQDGLEILRRAGVECIHIAEID